MANHQTIKGNWSEIKGKLRSRWGELTDDDLKECKGNVQHLVGTIQRKTGEARESIEQFFEHLTSGSAAEIQRVGDAVYAGAQQASDSIKESYQDSAASLRKGYAEVEDVVQQGPAKSLLVSFGAGILTGIAMTLFLRRR
jgi:uncharacterized protein YjbJ (UPF0337 family)